MLIRRLVLSVSAALLLVTGLAGCAAKGPSGLVQRVETLLGGPASAALLTGSAPSDSVVAFRIDGTAWHNAGDGEDTGERIYHWPVLGGPFPVDPAVVTSVGAVLADDGTYDWDRAKACEFAPGVVLRYTAGTDVSEVLFCFSCDELEIYRNGARVGHEDFDAARAPLVAAMKRLFPDDAKIQAL